MSVLFGWLPTEPGSRPTASVLARMERALRVRPEERATLWAKDAFGLGVLTANPCAPDEAAPVRHVVEGGRHHFWVVGEIYAGDVDASLTPGFGDVGSLDGEFVLVHWDADERRLQLVNDRFGGLPIYWAQSNEGFAVAGGVRGVLAAPGIGRDPDEDALREAVTFGGFRLGERTNVRGVRMIPSASRAVFADGALRTSRYWSYSDISPVEAPSEPELFERAGFLWERAIAKRLDTCDRPGQTLSGGLDSRAILAEAAHRAPRWTAITYGISGCDDERFARAAARVAKADWCFHDLYQGPEDWLDARAAHIQDTDGLIALGDLMHVESVHVQARTMHVHYSGYIGDVVCGPTYSDITRIEDLYAQLPYYGTGLGMDGAAAHERLLALTRDLDRAPLRFAIFEHKFPQSTNRWVTAWRPWLKVRKPFLDYELFDFWQGLPLRVRQEDNAYERLLHARYPRFYERIPNQKTGVPILTPPWRRRLVRAGRYALRRAGLSSSVRNYFDDQAHASRAEFRDRIEDTILRSDSLSCAILGRDRVTEVVTSWLDRNAGPEQVVGALYVFEAYHRDLAEHLKRAEPS